MRLRRCSSSCKADSSCSSRRRTGGGSRSPWDRGIASLVRRASSTVIATTASTGLFASDGGKSESRIYGLHRSHAVRQSRRPHALLIERILEGRRTSMARLRHFAIVVRDLEKSAKFYESVFDLKRVGQETLDFAAAI